MHKIGYQDLHEMLDKLSVDPRPPEVILRDWQIDPEALGQFAAESGHAMVFHAAETTDAPSEQLHAATFTSGFVMGYMSCWRVLGSMGS